MKITASGFGSGFLLLVLSLCPKIEISSNLENISLFYFKIGGETNEFREIT